MYMLIFYGVQYVMYEIVKVRSIYLTIVCVKCVAIRLTVPILLQQICIETLIVSLM